MAETAPNQTDAPDEMVSSKGAKTKERRDIPGGFSYTTTPGVLKRTLDKLIVSERPSQFTQDFLGSVLQASGGSARPIIPILKRTGLLRADGVPTERYAQFQSDSRRPNAALDALKAGWSELFRRNQYAHRLDKKGTDDLFVEITGLTRDDPVFRNILGTYNVFKDLAVGAVEGSMSEESPGKLLEQEALSDDSGAETRGGQIRLGLANQINIVLPETTDIAVYNVIFRSLREHLLR